MLPNQPTSLSYSDPPGMSDEEEIRRWKEAMIVQPVGEVLVDNEDDLRMLGMIN